MQKERKKWRADAGSRAVKFVQEIEASISSLDDEDLLDLHDIFRGDLSTPIAVLALAKMRVRNLEP